MFYEIPIPTSAFSTLSISLDNQTFRLNFRWNTREQSWSMDLCKSDGVVIAGGLKIVANVDLTSRFQAVGAPPGAIISIGESTKAERPGRDELGKRVKLYYMDEVEFLSATT